MKRLQDMPAGEHGGMLRNQDGATIVVALVILIALTLAGLTALKFTSSDVQTAIIHKKGAKSLYIAEAGLERARAALAGMSMEQVANLVGTDLYSQVTFSSGKYTVSIAGDYTYTPPAAAHGCAIRKEHGGGYATEITSVTNNGGSYTITLTGSHEGCQGGTCKELSHYSIEAASGTHSNHSYQITSGAMNVGELDPGPELGNDAFNYGFKLDECQGIGDGQVGEFTVTYTLTGNLQDQRVAVKTGSSTMTVDFAASEFEQVLTCGAGAVGSSSGKVIITSTGWLDEGGKHKMVATAEKPNNDGISIEGIRELF